VTEETNQESTHSSEPGATFNPLEQLLQLLALVDPIEFASKAIDTTRRTTETLVVVLENFASTIDNLNRTTTRINSLLDEVEEPLKRVMPQLGNAMNAMAAMGEAATQLGDLSKKLGPLTTLAENAGGLFGFRPGKPSGNQNTTTTSSSPQTES
jgi:ABC-type transporter Mla subunit MlaD